MLDFNKTNVFMEELVKNLIEFNEFNTHETFKDFLLILLNHIKKFYKFIFIVFIMLFKISCKIFYKIFINLVNVTSSKLQRTLRKVRHNYNAY